MLAQTLNPMPLVDPVRRFVLYTNAKCGGTTLKTWFFENVGFPTLHWRPATLFPAFGPAYAMAHLRRGAWLAFRATSAGRGGGPRRHAASPPGCPRRRPARSRTIGRS